ncbi:MAG: hypothetical protein NZO58_04135, partial [Gemmataceae bacterium]|nr:hypothetical protein [Gemmataceae bacterium]
MAVGPGFSRLHLIFRLLGLTGVFVLALAGAFMFALPEEFHDAAFLAMIGGAAAVGGALLVEARALIHFFGSRRAALGSNVVMQTLLAVVFVAGVNVWSFLHYVRFDWTAGKDFTLPDDVRAQLAQLRGETDIVVLQQYVQRGESKEDKYDLAAHKKIVEKIQDLAELFQDLGARFRVVLLDIQNDNFDAMLRQLKKDKPALAEAIEKAPENSIFFHANGKVQRLAFHDVYQIDKKASAEDNNGLGNLVLNYQGVGPIARRILNIEERPPRIANAVVHPVLTLSDHENLYLTMNGAKKVLDAHGFDCKDLLMRKVEEGGGLSPDPAVLTFQEGRYEQIEEELVLVNEAIEKMEKSQAEATRLLKLWRDSSLAELNKTYCYVIFPGGSQGVLPRSQLDALKKTGRPFKVIDVDDDDKQAHVKAYERELVILQAELEMARSERDSLLKERKTLNVDALAEKRRITDIEIKMKRELADRDLLIVPRVTALNIPRGTVISNPNRVHKLDPAQIAAIKAFLKSGKAVLFLLGPTNEP